MEDEPKCLSEKNLEEYLTLNKVDYKLNNTPIITDISFKLFKGQIACLLGPSGCGKTTLLRTIAGFNKLSAGNISLNKKVIADQTIHQLPEKRKIGMIFQDFALFPHLNTLQNVTFGLHKQPKKKRVTIASNILDKMELKEKINSYPTQLSGGQQQRLAIARALAPNPNLLLLDEPLSSLDQALREELGTRLRILLKKNNVTALMVTHDIQEAFAMSDCIGVMSNGELLQWDTPFNLYHKPINETVARLIGPCEFIDGNIVGNNQVQTAIGLITGKSISTLPKETSVKLLIRPDDLIPDKNGPIKGKIDKKIFKGAQTYLHLTINEQINLIAIVPSHLQCNTGDHLNLKLDMQHLVAFKTKLITL